MDHKALRGVVTKGTDLCIDTKVLYVDRGKSATHCIAAFSYCSSIEEANIKRS